MVDVARMSSLADAEMIYEASLGSLYCEVRTIEHRGPEQLIVHFRPPGWGPRGVRPGQPTIVWLALSFDQIWKIKSENTSEK